MRARYETLEVAVSLLEDGIEEEVLSAAMAAHPGIRIASVDADLPFAVAE